MRIVFVVIKISDFFIKNVVLNINTLNFSLYSTYQMLFNFRKYFLTNINSLKSLYTF